MFASKKKIVLGLVAGLMAGATQAGPARALDLALDPAEGRVSHGVRILALGSMIPGKESDTTRTANAMARIEEALYFLSESSPRIDALLAKLAEKGEPAIVYVPEVAPDNDLVPNAIGALIDDMNFTQGEGGDPRTGLLLGARADALGPEALAASIAHHLLGKGLRAADGRSTKGAEAECDGYLTRFAFLSERSATQRDDAVLAVLPKAREACAGVIGEEEVDMVRGAWGLIDGLRQDAGLAALPTKAPVRTAEAEAEAAPKEAREIKLSRSKSPADAAMAAASGEDDGDDDAGGFWDVAASEEGKSEPAAPPAAPPAAEEPAAVDEGDEAPSSFWDDAAGGEPGDAPSPDSVDDGLGAAARPETVDPTPVLDLEAIMTRVNATSRSPEAQFALAKDLLDGGENTQTEGFTWLRDAAVNGHLVSQRMLGSAYLDGQWTAPDPYRAYVWIKVAAQRGDSDAMALVPRVEGTLNPLQQRRADHEITTRIDPLKEPWK